MGVPLSQMWTVARYVLGKKLRGVERYPLVLMLEPLFRCNLACAGCGKIQYPADILKKMYVLRRILNPMGTVDAIEFLLGKLRETPKGNQTFFDSMNT